MKTGRQLPELLQEVLRQQETKRDFLAPTVATAMTNDLDLVFGDQRVGINDMAHEQLGAHARIPAQYYDRMRREDPKLLANNVNAWFARFPVDQVRQIRTLDGKARAYLSDRYRALDNSDLLEACLPPLLDRGVEVMSCEVTERKLYIKVVDQRIKRDLPTGWSPTARGHQRFDTISPAVVISNSEVGWGSLAVQGSVWTGGCTNLMVIKERSVRKYHVGAKLELGEEVYRMLSEQTKKLSDAALWSQLRDVVQGAFDEAAFDAQVDRLKAATEDKITADPVKVVELTSKKFGFTDGERGQVLRHLIAGGDLTKYGLHAAVTRAAEDLADYDRASQFEAIGGQVVELPKSEWKVLAEAA